MNTSLREGLSYNDVLLVPKKTRVQSRKDILTQTRLTKNLSLNIPIVSANMDTVTESRMAITLAQMGGIGIIHRFMSIEDQVEMVKKVKRAENNIIHDPYTVSTHNTVREIKEYAKKVGVNGFLVVDNAKNLLGIVSKRDYLFVRDEQIKVEAIMTPRERLIVAQSLISIEEAEALFREYKIEKLPIVSLDNKLIGLMTSIDCAKVRDHVRSSKDNNGRFLVGAAIGVKDYDNARAYALAQAGCDVLVIDIAHGHSEYAIERIISLKATLPSMDLIAGNIATAQGAYDLIHAGADAIKVGVGPGSMCSTRIVTGAGVPQLTAIMDCAEVAKEYGIPLIADGGITSSGDMVKALAAGAETIMVGSLLAGTEESPGIFLTRDHMKYKLYRGMASVGAALSKLRVDGKKVDADVNDITPEGVETLVAYKGSAKEVIKNLTGGLLSGISYCGATTIQELQANAEFMKITSAGWQESIPHGKK